MIRSDDPDHSIEIQNSTDFGLTAGLHSLDPAEIERWTERVEAGNLYINRGITGAIVQRQPFGGWKRSVVGPTAKAGGPNYVATLRRWVDDGLVDADDVAVSFAAWWRTTGSMEHDATGLTIERNVFRYRSLSGGVAIRFGPLATERHRTMIRAAARTTGCRLVVSEAAAEDGSAFAARVAGAGVDRYRAVGLPIEPEVAVACHRAGVSVDDAEPVGAPERCV